jgi:predicted nucleic acid-binding protein
MSYLVDTNVISELFKKKNDAAVVDWLRGNDFLNLSVITVEEINYGLRYINATKHLKWFENFIATRTQVLAVELRTAEIAGTLRAAFRKRGMQRTQADLLIAATAQTHKLTVVTRNERDFIDCQVPVLNPFP